MDGWLEFYYRDNAKQLRALVRSILSRKFGRVLGKDLDEYYSAANHAFAEIACRKTYDPNKGDRDGYLYGALSRALCEEWKRQNCGKRKQRAAIRDEAGEVAVGRDGKPKWAYLEDVSLDAPIDGADGPSLGETLWSGDRADVCLEGSLEGGAAGKYLERLSKTQRQIAIRKMEGVPASVIKRELGLSDKRYRRHCEELKEFSSACALYESGTAGKDKEDEETMTGTGQTMERCKTDKISISSIIKKIDGHTIRFDHPLQRESGQWSASMKGNLVSDILQGNRLHPLVFAEQVIHGIPIIWDLDGKQRCTNAYLYSKNGYKVSRHIRRPMIRYQAAKKDGNGNAVLDGQGFPVVINMEFDIRGKKFCDLPDELKDRFLDYSFNYDQYLNCSEEDIGYHIERYNDGKPMTASQRGVTRLGAAYAKAVKELSRRPFFLDIGNYKASEFKNGAVGRVVVESVMAAYYIEDWKKEQEYQCEYLRQNASEADFARFGELVDRLERAVTKETARLFDAKDSFLWFGLFARFAKTGHPDEAFISFLAEFSRSLHGKNVGGRTYDSLCADPKTGKAKATKDRGIVLSKMELLWELLRGHCLRTAEKRMA